MASILEGTVTVSMAAVRRSGFAHALAFAAAGKHVVVDGLGRSDRGEGTDFSFTQTVVEEVGPIGAEEVANICSVADWQSARLIRLSTVHEFADMDILVNNARKIDAALPVPV